MTTTPATRYIYDASGTRLRFTISPEGRVSEYRYDNYGQRTSSIQYLTPGWLWWSTPGEGDMVAWVNSVDRSKAQRTDYAYDWRGQLTRSYTYDSVDAAGNGLGQSLTQYVYDAAGQLLKTIDARNGVMQSTYDGLGRVLTVTNALNQVSVNSYDDVGGSRSGGADAARRCGPVATAGTAALPGAPLGRLGIRPWASLCDVVRRAEHAWMRMGPRVPEDRACFLHGYTRQRR